VAVGVGAPQTTPVISNPITPPTGSTPGTPTTPVPPAGTGTVPAPAPGGRPIIVPAILLDFWADDSADPTPRSGGREMGSQVKVQRGKLRHGRGGKWRQTLTLRNTGRGDVTDLKLAFARLPKNARVRLNGGAWVSAAQAARGVSLQDDVLGPGE